MELITLESPLLFLSDSFYFGYTLFCIASLPGRLFTRNLVKKELINWLAAINLSFAFFSILSILLLSYELYTLFVIKSDYEEFAFYTTELNGVPLPWIISVAANAVSLLFFSRKLRISWVISLLVLLLMHAERILVLVTDLYKDYLPSSWLEENSIYFVIIEVLVFAIVVLLMYRWLAKRKKLPYPSAWIR